jgi:CPA2 family monovalent cation:H+ antiporter-2
VVFLMFVIGLEFNLPKLHAMRQHVFGLGLAQVLGTMAVVTGGALLLAWLLPQHWPMSWQGALALGGALAMSSTAIVVKMMSDRLELESEHGQRIIGVLLLQDLAVVPLLVLIPALGSSPEDLLAELAVAGLKAVGLITILLWGGQRVMRWWLTLVARRKSQELFVLNLLLMALGLAWLTEYAGLSLALGAFIAGMLISETEYKHQVETDIRPFHDVLLGIFFISIGMLLDWRLVLERWQLVVILLVGPVLFKVGLITVLARVLGATTGVALRTGLYLAQAGEFGFVLLTLAQREELVSPGLLNPILASMVLSMILTPFIVTYSNAIVNKLVANDWMQASLQMTQIARKSINTAQHVIICGFGRSGQNLARLLEAEKIPYIALDLDPDRVRQAAAAGDSVVFGDAARVQALTAAGLTRASAVVVTFLDVNVALKVLDTVHQHAPKVPVVVRTQDDLALDKLRAAGAAEVVPEALEGSLMLAGHALALVGVPMRRVIRIVQDQRDARYNLLKGYFHGADDDGVDDLAHVRLMSVTLPAASVQAGRSLGDLGLDAAGVRVVSLRRTGGRSLEPAADTVLESGDVLVLSGTAEMLAGAEARLLGA